MTVPVRTLALVRDRFDETGDSMTALAAMVKPTQFGWVVLLTDGRELARFFGPGSKRRALRYLTTLGRGA
jgi:hypothetical protein